MSVVEIAVLLIVGAIAGFGINLAADAAPVRGRLWPPRCAACDGPLLRRQWSGTLSLLGAGAHCSYCGEPRPLRWSIVELAAMAVTIGLWTSGAGLSPGINAIVFAWAMLLIAVTDIEHRLIPHVVSLPAIALLVVGHGADPGRGWDKVLLGAAAGFLIVWLLYLLGGVFGRWIGQRRGEPLDEIAFGFGDVTLSTALGAAAGWPGIVLAIMIGVLAAGGFSLMAILVMAIRGRYQPYLPIPYGPFLILGAALVYFGGSALFSSALGP